VVIKQKIKPTPVVVANALKSVTNPVIKDSLTVVKDSLK
jgi:hypothetical protein